MTPKKKKKNAIEENLPIVPVVTIKVPNWHFDWGSSQSFISLRYIIKFSTWDSTHAHTTHTQTIQTTQFRYHTSYTVTNT